jgi:cytochrome bd-type quinol oxidase subunit 2
MSVTDDKTYGVSRKRFLVAGAIAGLVAVVINNIYQLSYTAITGYAEPMVINLITVSLASFVPIFLAALVYYFLAKNTSQPTLIFVIVTIFMTISSMGAMAAPVFPDRDAIDSDFYGLAIPMHFIAGGIAAVVIPVYVTRGRRKADVKEHA